MHILQIYPLSKGGMLKYTEILNRNLLNHNDDIIISNFVICPDEERSYFDQFKNERNLFYFVNDSVEFTETNILNDCSIPWIERIFESYIEQVSPDVAIFQQLDLLGTSLIGLAHDHGIATIVTLHDYWFLCPRFFLLKKDFSLCRGPNQGIHCHSCREEEDNDLWGNDRKSYLLRYMFMKDMLISKCDRIIAVSNSVRIKFVQEGIPEGKIKTIYPVVEEQVFFQNKDRADERCIHFGFIGNVLPHKGIQVLIKAFNNISNDGAAKLHIYGSVDQLFKETLYRLIGNNDNIILHGRYIYNDLSNINENIDVLFVPSILPETGPLVIQEGLRFGTPVIASNIGGASEYIKESYGMLVKAGAVDELSAVMEMIISDPSIIKTWQKNIPILSDPNEYFMEYISMLNEIVDSKKDNIVWNIAYEHVDLLNHNDKILIKKEKLLENFKKITIYILNQNICSVAVFGVGRYGRKVAHSLKNLGIRVECFLDNDRGKWGNEFSGIYVLSPKYFLNNIGDTVDLIIIVSEWEKEILLQLKNICQIPCVGLLGGGELNARTLGK